MRPTYRFLAVGCLGLVSVLSSLGCASHRVYDPYRNDYHRWNNHETVYYQRWEVEGHRDHRDYDRRNKEEQNEYWRWRHDQH